MYIYSDLNDDEILDLIIEPTTCNHVKHNKICEDAIQKLDDIVECDNPWDRLDEILCVRNIAHCGKILTNNTCRDHGERAYGKSEVVWISKPLLAICAKVDGKYNKYKVCVELFAFIEKNKMFLVENGKFSNIVYKKYLELFNDSGLTVDKWDGLMKSFITTFVTEDISYFRPRSQILLCPEGSMYSEQIS